MFSIENISDVLGIILCLIAMKFIHWDWKNQVRSKYIKIRKEFENEEKR